MKKNSIKNKVTVFFVIITLWAIPVISFAQGGPPPPPGGPGGGDKPAEGGGAPIGGGSFILIGLAAAYGGKKLYSVYNKTAQELEE